MNKVVFYLIIIIIIAALLCLRGSRTITRRNNLDMGDADLDVEKTEARIH